MPENTILGNVTSDVISDQQFEYMRLISQIMQDTKCGDKPVAYIRTYGCQQNVADSERIKGMLEIAGFEFSETVDDADFILFNTCAIREHAEDRVFGNVGALKSLKRKHPQIVIALCGCMMEQEHIANKMYKSFPFVSLVFVLILCTVFHSFCIIHLQTASVYMSVTMMTKRFTREYLSSVTALSRAGFQLCTAATISAHTALCLM